MQNFTTTDTALAIGVQIMGHAIKKQTLTEELQQARRNKDAEAMQQIMQHQANIDQLINELRALARTLQVTPIESTNLYMEMEQARQAGHLDWIERGANAYVASRGKISATGMPMDLD